MFVIPQGGLATTNFVNANNNLQQGSQAAMLNTNSTIPATPTNAVQAVNQAANLANKQTQIATGMQTPQAPVVPQTTQPTNPPPPNITFSGGPTQSLGDRISSGFTDIKNGAVSAAQKVYDNISSFITGESTPPDTPDMFRTADGTVYSSPVKVFNDDGSWSVKYSIAGDLGPAVGTAEYNALPIRGADGNFYSAGTAQSGITNGGFFDSLNSMAKKGSDWFAQNKDLVQGAQTMWNIFNGINTYLMSKRQAELAEDQYHTQKDMMYKNYNNQRKAYNTALSDRYRTRGFVEKGDEHAYDAEYEKNKM